MKRYLIDTNVLVAVSLSRAEAIEYVENLQRQGSLFFTTLQVICEFWNVCTRPNDRNGLGLSPELTLRAVDRLQIGFPTLPEPETAYSALLHLLRDTRVAGRQIYDARLAAAVRVYGLDGIITYNDRDFVRYPHVNPLSPKNRPQAVAP